MTNVEKVKQVIKEKENQEVIPIANLPKDLAEIMSLAQIFVMSGMFKDTISQAQGVVKILAGKELDLTPLQAMSNLYIVNSKIGMASQLMASKIKASGKYDYHIDELTNETCVITFFEGKNGERKEIGKSSFTKDDAIKCGLINKDSFKNYPKNMLFARALSNGFRWYCPDALKLNVYTEEEIIDIQENK
jgi:hypothetical protein